MTVADVGPFYARLAALSEVFDAKFSEAKAELYFDALRDLPFEAVSRGLSEALKTCRFMPRPAELRELAVGDVASVTEQAWMAFRRAMSLAGQYASLVTTDAALGETIVAMFGSWPEACATELSAEMWANKRKEFERVYRVLRDRALTGDRFLAGTCERHNALRGHDMKFVPVYRVELDARCVKLSPEAATAERVSFAPNRRPFEQLTDGAVSAMPAKEQLMALVPASVKTESRPRTPLITKEFERAAENDPVLAGELARRRRKAVDAEIAE